MKRIYDVFATTKFKKDLKIAIKRGNNTTLMDAVVSTLGEGKPLAEKYQDHLLKREYKGCRECHITPD